MSPIDIELVEELQEIFREEYGYKMPLADAQRAAAWLAAVFDALARETRTEVT